MAARLSCVRIALVAALLLALAALAHGTETDTIPERCNADTGVCDNSACPAVDGGFSSIQPNFVQTTISGATVSGTNSASGVTATCTAKGTCLASGKAHCFGTVTASSDTDYVGQFCLVDGNSDNFKICFPAELNVGGGACSPDQAACCTSTACVTSTCILVLGSPVCVDTPINEGGSCPDDGNVCTNDVCSTGVCTHPNGADHTPCSSAPVEHPDNPCTDQRCSAGACANLPVLDPSTVTCTDNNRCTVDDQCVAGTCVGTNKCCGPDKKGKCGICVKSCGVNTYQTVLDFFNLIGVATNSPASINGVVGAGWQCPGTDVCCGPKPDIPAGFGICSAPTVLPGRKML